MRHANSVEAVPALQMASYAMLLLAALRAVEGPLKPDLLPRPKWAGRMPQRFSAQRAVNHLRAEVWGPELGLKTFSGFASLPTPHTKPEKLIPQLSSAVLYAVN